MSKEKTLGELGGDWGQAENLTPTEFYIHYTLLETIEKDLEPTLNKYNLEFKPLGTRVNQFSGEIQIVININWKEDHTMYLQETLDYTQNESSWNNDQERMKLLENIINECEKLGTTSSYDKKDIIKDIQFVIEDGEIGSFATELLMDIINKLK